MGRFPVLVLMSVMMRIIIFIRLFGGENDSLELLLLVVIAAIAAIGQAIGYSLGMRDLSSVGLVGAHRFVVGLIDYPIYKHLYWG
jgi:hypothetical protein